MEEVSEGEGAERKLFAKWEKVKKRNESRNSFVRIDSRVPA